MKNFKNYTPEKYHTPEYKEVHEGIYLAKKPYDDTDGGHGEEEYTGLIIE